MDTGRASRPAPYGWLTAGAYILLAVVLTWPTVTRLATSVAGDYGDSLFVAWAIGWAGDHLTAILTGHLDAWAAMWQAPIFAPAPAAFSFSEHFLGQTLQALPALWITGNALLGYNVVLLATIALTGYFAHRLTFQLTARHDAAAVAGLLATANDYRFLLSIGHLHTLSIQWWLAALWAIDVYAASASRTALTGVALALLALHLSSNYLMAYTAPFTAMFVVWALWRHGRLGDPRRWLGLAAAGATSVAVIVPLALRYLATRDALGAARSVGEIAANSATLDAYRQAVPWLAPIALLACAGLVAPTERGALSRAQRWALAVMAAAAVALSFGPAPSLGGHTITGPYEWLRHVIPGFSGLRVPHRFVTIVTSLLAVLAGIGAAWLGRRRVVWLGVAVLVALATRTAWTRPFPIDQELETAPLNAPSAMLRPSATTPPIYRVVAALPPEAVVVELPFGPTAYEIRYTFFTRAHRHRIVNGYSGILPPDYLRRRAVLQAPLADPDASWAALGPATHVIVHAGAWPDDTGSRLRAWLVAHGARQAAVFDGTWLYALPR